MALFKPIISGKKLVCKLIDEELIIPRLKGRDRNAVIKELATILYKKGKIYSKTEFVCAVEEREACLSTKIDSGIAIPHAKSNSVKEMALAIGISDGINWNGSKEDNDVRIIFLLAIPTTIPAREHIVALKAITSLLVQESIRNKIVTASTSQDILNIMNEVNTSNYKDKE